MSEYNIQMNKYNAINAEYDQLYPQPMKHANTHAKDGNDPITPSMIGTYNKTEIDTALQNKAPAGYGLGMKSNSSIYDADNITAFGFYTAKTNTPTNDWCTILNIPYGQNRATQFSTLGEAVNANKYSYCKREKIDGIWKPWEWVNPRMELGVEYRTTERYLGKPVYVKEYDCGTFPEVNTEKYVSLDISDLQYVVRYSATCRTKTLPYYNGNTTTLSQQVDVIGIASSVPKIRLHSGTGTSTTEKAYVTVFYTKTTD